MKKGIQYVVMLLLLCGAWSCEEEGDPLTLEKLFKENGLPTEPFSLVLSGFDFDTKQASAIKTNTSISIEAKTNEVTYVLSIADVEEGKYFGSNNDLRNFLNYKDAQGLLFSTTKRGVVSDYEVEITNYNKEKKTVSGNFSGTLISSTSDFKLPVTNGSFLDVPVESPNFGEMTATVDEKEFIAESCTFTANTSGGFTFETILGVGNQDSTSINITIEENIAEKEYSFSGGPLTGTYVDNAFSTNVFKNRYDADAGKLTISEIDLAGGTVSGTFNMTVRNAFGEPITISEGRFVGLIK